MARNIKSRLKVKGHLVAISPIHVGGIGGNAQTDMALALNGKGEYYIPGTSLAGALREWMGSESQFINALWGYQDAKSDRGHASFVLVEDAPIQAKAEIRDGVGIDRYYGTAAEHFKFDRAILPRGSRIPLEITIEQNPHKDWERAKAEWVELLTALQNKEIRLGAAKTRGLGLVKLENLKILDQNLSTRQGILNTLRDKGTGTTLGALSNQPVTRNNPKLYIEIQWQPISPVMVKAEADGIAVDSLPLVSANGSGLTFVLPGSSIKGALRTQAERIMRTVLDQPVPNGKSKQNFSNQLEQVELIRELFGASAKIKDKEQHGRIGALAVDDCYASVNISENQWQDITSAEKELPLRNALDQAGLNNTQQAFHVAIDRWTGGAADGFLYSTLEPMGVNWEPIQLTLDLNPERLPVKDQLPIVALLSLMLRDLSTGKIPLGYGVNRGMGAIVINNIKLTGSGLDTLLPSLNFPLDLQGGNTADLGQEVLQQLTSAWQAKIIQLQQEAN
ncbi:RAMP superfamily CRISPR-associated protein [Pseudanabaena mucicola]|uniref:RAMP superfamily CRISPR-associated protein n=1 Tax=Pseudanabaena mucicola TaxID=71190 RepID=UPI002575A20E|nr:RAMP superfamily CRISPR-associated protein [Pseudanabaena mucicola]